MKRTGIDISELRLDDLDKEVIKYSLSSDYNSKTKRFADFGCGFGKVSISLGLLGFFGYLFDQKPLTAHFNKLSKILGINLIFKKSKIEELRYSNIPKKIDIVISQRTLHYLKHKDVLTFLKQASKSLNSGGRIFFSFSGMDSELAKGYDGEMDLEERFSVLSKANQEKFGISEPVCLYTKKEVEEIFRGFDFEKVRVWQSDFGNIKAIYKRN